MELMISGRTIAVATLDASEGLVGTEIKASVGALCWLRCDIVSTLERETDPRPWVT
jgi:hypothetical protein